MLLYSLLPPAHHQLYCILQHVSLQHMILLNTGRKLQVSNYSYRLLLEEKPPTRVECTTQWHHVNICSVHMNTRTRMCSDPGCSVTQGSVLFHVHFTAASTLRPVLSQYAKVVPLFGDLQTMLIAQLCVYTGVCYSLLNQWTTSVTVRFCDSSTYL